MLKKEIKCYRNYINVGLRFFYGYRSIIIYIKKQYK